MDQFEEFEGRSGACSVCEAMLPEAVDGMLSETEQSAFDKHVAGCVECARELAEARRGAAWLSMLKSQAPEPPAGLLAKILAETTGAAQNHVIPAAAPALIPARPAGAPAVVELQKGFADQRPPLRKRWDGFLATNSARIMFQPRLAMTAAMAFFSLALTLNLTGVRLRDLRASNFTPSAIKRTVADMNASATRKFQNNRAVYQVESRLSDLHNDEDASPAGRR
jgi:anti-sigma factor RsiW